MERLKKVMQENPVAAMVGAAFFGAAAYQAYKSVFCDDENATSLQEAETQLVPGSRRQLSLRGRLSMSQRDQAFDFHKWASTLPAPGPSDMETLLDALEGEIPILTDLHFLTEESLKGYGIKPLTRARILAAVRRLEGSKGKFSASFLALPKIDTVGNAPLSTDVLSSKQDLSDVTSWEGKRVVIRVDYNVPIKDGVVTDTTRISETIPTLKYILDPKIGGTPNCVIVICHLGRPAGNFNREKFTLKPCIPVLKKLLPEGTTVEFCNSCVGPEVEEAIRVAKPGTVILCENLRFHPEEAGEDVDDKGRKILLPREKVALFENELSSLGDIFVFEAFGVSHRKAASVTGITIPVRVAGLLMQKELQFYSRVFSKPKRPFLAIVGGAKVSDKIQVLENLLNQCDEIIIGGGMAYTFKKVLEGVKIGSSIFDEEGAKLVGQIMRKARERGVKVHLPVDHIIADRFSWDANYGVTSDELGIPDGWMALDVGPLTRGINKQAIMRAQTILWNGPLGVFELGPFSGGTLSAMVYLAEARKTNGTTTVIGGGDTGAASQKFFYGEKPISELMSHVSTGGGSSLVLMEGKMLPAVPALSDKVR